MEIDDINSTIISEAGAVVSGDMHMQGENIAGRDLWIVENNTIQSDWNTVNLSSYSAERYISPVFTNMLATQLKENRLLILAGGTGFDKEFFVRHLAWLLSIEYPDIEAQQTASNDYKADNLFSQIREKDKNTVFILSNFTPKEIDFNADGLFSCAKGNHFIIITTELPLSTWQLPDHQQRRYWYDIPLSDLYSGEQIVEILVSELNESTNRLAFESGIVSFSPASRFFDGKPLSQVAAVFKAPEQVQLFIELLKMEKQPVSEKMLEGIISSFGNSNEALVSKWFRKLNSEKEKLLVIAAALLDGVYEDQFFELLNLITEKFWHYRDVSLYALDYIDLEFLMQFYTFDETEKGRLIKGRFPFQRADILATAWKTHRRHILSVLPVLDEVAKQSRYKVHMKKELHNSRHKRMVMRATIAETYSDLGTVYLPAVEEKLLRLAATDDESLQRITAKAILRWKLLGNEERLYGLLWKWLGNTEAIGQVADILQETDEKVNLPVKAKKSLYNVVLLTLQYVVENEGHNQLPDRLIRMIKFLLYDSYEPTAHQYKNFITKLLTSHYIQVRPLFTPEFIYDKDQRELMVEIMVKAYSLYPEETIAWIDSWMVLALDRKPGINMLLQTLLRLYVELPGEVLEDENMFAKTWEYLKAIYTSGKDRLVSGMYFAAVQRLFAINTQLSLAPLKQLFSYSTIEERARIMACLANVYKTQRALLKGSNYTIKIDEETYPYWYPPRPYTKIEETLYTWMHGSDAQARDIALLALAEFANAFDRKELLATPQFIPQVEDTQSNNSRYSTYQSETLLQQRSQVWLPQPSFSLRTRIIFFFWLLFETADNRILIKQYINTLHTHRQLVHPAAQSILIRNLKVKNTLKTNRVARWMERLYGIK